MNKLIPHKGGCTRPDDRFTAYPREMLKRIVINHVPKPIITACDVKTALRPYLERGDAFKLAEGDASSAKQRHSANVLASQVARLCNQSKSGDPVQNLRKLPAFLQSLVELGWTTRYEAMTATEMDALVLSQGITQAELAVEGRQYFTAYGVRCPFVDVLWNEDLVLDIAIDDFCHDNANGIFGTSFWVDANWQLIPTQLTYKNTPEDAKAWTLHYDVAQENLDAYDNKRGTNWADMDKGCKKAFDQTFTNRRLFVDSFHACKAIITASGGKKGRTLVMRTCDAYVPQPWSSCTITLHNFRPMHSSGCTLKGSPRSFLQQFPNARTAARVRKGLKATIACSNPCATLQTR